MDLSEEFVLDIHAHVGHHPLFGSLFGTYFVDELVGAMDKYHIDMAAVSSFECIWHDCKQGNAQLLEGLAKYPGRLIGLSCVNPLLRGKGVRMFEENIKAGMRGLKLHPERHRYRADSPVVYPLVEKAVDLEVPIYIHCYADLWHPGESPCGPDKIAKLAKDFPTATMILGHMAVSDPLGAIDAALSCDNIILDMSWQIIQGSVEKAVQEVGAHRVVFGTDMLLFNPGVMESIVLNAEIEDHQKRLILGQNAAKIFGPGKAG